MSADSSKWHLPLPPLSVQLEALKRGADRTGFAYFMEQGLGKTATAIADWLHNLIEGRVGHLVVLCPNSIKDTVWAAEFGKLGITSYKIFVWPKVPKAEDLEEPVVFIINYEALIHSGGDWLAKFVNENNCMLVADESSCIKNFQAKSTKKALSIAQEAVMRRVLTGTPMSQNVMDLWPQLRFIGELSGVNPFAFRNKYAVMGGYMGKQVKGIKNEEQLHRLQELCSFRALKEDWLDLPEKIYVQREFEMTKEQLRIYKEMEQDFIALVNGEEVSVEMVISAMVKLRQISRGFIMKGKDDFEVIVEPKKNPLIRAVQETLEETRGKTLIAVHHRAGVRFLREALPDAAVLEGGDMKRLAEEKARFNDDATCRQAICQIDATQMGHTLLAGAGDDRCSSTSFFENTYSLLKRLQFEDRNHRVGQDRGVVYTDYIGCKLDRVTLQALRYKEDVADVVVNYFRKR